jgi:rfaE bifunctional protein nucleotidyltransferase chain/domain
MSTGSSMGDQYGPMIVSEQNLSEADLENLTIAVPGKMTTALLSMRLYNPKLKYEVVPFDQIIPQIKAGKYKAGLIIHEGQLTYAEQGLHKIVDMGQWWFKDTGLPLPLGGNVIRRDLGDKLIIGLNSDDSVRRLKGKGRPVQDENARAALLAAFSFVDAVVVFDEDTPFKLISTLIPDILVKGSDYSVENIVGADVVLKNGGKVETIDFLEGYSTSSIIDKILNTR